MTDHEPQAEPDWSLTKRVGFRFTFLYLGMYVGPEVLWAPVTWGLEEHWHQFIDERLWGPVVRWVATHALHITPTGPYTSYGGGWELLSMTCLALLAAVVTVAWSYADRQRRHYAVLYRWFRVYLRFAIAVLLINFGINKVLLFQMGLQPAPSLLFGLPALYPPRALLWTFMGTSPLYQGFAGVVETVAGVLLMVRRTALLGALLAIAAMTNVVVIDWGYQVDGPGLYATHVLLMALILVIPDVRRLADMFLYQRPVLPPVTRPLVAKPALDRALTFGGALLLTWVVAHTFYLYAYGYPGAVRWWNPQWPPLYGAYDVEAFASNGDTIPPLLTASRRWRRLFVNGSAGPLRAVGEVQFMADSIHPTFLFQIDTLERRLTFWAPREPAQKAVWVYAEPDPQHLILDGPAFLFPGPNGAMPAHSDSLHVVLRRIDLSELAIFRPRRWFQ